MKYLITLLIIGCSFLASGQSDTTEVLFHAEPIKVRPVFTLGYQASSVNRSLIHAVRVGFGLIANKRVELGLYGSISTTSPKYISWGTQVVDPNVAKYLTFLEGGGVLGYHFKPYKALHISVYSKFSSIQIQNAEGETILISDDTFAFIPEIEAEINLTKSMRLGFGIGYRFTKMDKLFYQQNEMNSMVFTGLLKFGKFSK